MKLSEIHYSNKFDDLDSQLKNFINQEKHVIFIDSKLSSIINLDPKFKIFELEINESTKDLNTIQKIWKIMFSESYLANLSLSQKIYLIFCSLDNWVSSNLNLLHDFKSIELISF